MCSQEERAYFDAELKACNSGIRKLKILELGFGNGSFAGWARSNGHDYFGLELIPELVARAKSLRFNAAETPNDLTELFEQDSFDLVVAFDVFEHIETERLIELLRQLLKILRPGGKILARFPSGDSPFARAYQHGDITHKSCLGSSAIRQIAGTVGAVIISIRGAELPLKGVPLRSKVRRLTSLVLRRPLFWFLSTVIMGNPNAVLSPNLVTVLQRPVKKPNT